MSGKRCSREEIRQLRILRNQVSSLTAVRMLKIINHNQYSGSEPIKSSVKDVKTYPRTGGKSLPRS